MSDKEEFRQTLNAIISALGNSCNERQMRSTFYKETGENLNVQLQRFGIFPLAEFLRMECSDFCALTYNGSEVRIERTHSEKSQHLDHLTKSGQRNFSQNQQRHFRPQYPQIHPNPQQHFKPQQNPPSIDPLNLQIAIDQNVFWYNTNLIVFNSGTLSPFAAEIAKRQMDIARSEIFAILRLVALHRNQQLAVQEPNVNIFNFPNPTNHQNQNFPKLPETPTPVKPVNFPIVETPKSATMEPLKVDATQSPASQVSQVSTPPKPTITVAEKELTESTSNCSSSAESLAAKGTLDIRIVVIESPEEFWFHYDEEGLESLMTEMNDYYLMLPVDRLSCAKEVDMAKGALIATHFAGFWHRGEVISEDENCVDVFFVDYGTRHLIPKLRIRYLFSNFKKISRKAHKGKLANVSPPQGDQWTDQQIDAFQDKVADKPLKATIENVLNSVYDLEIINDRVNIGEEMVKEGFAKNASQ